MLIRRREDGAVVVRTPAKVNLFLEVLGKRPDGYHELTTLMLAVGLFDTLEFKDDPSGALRLQSDHPHLSTGPDNLVVRAAELLRRHAGGAVLGASVRLHKRIPLAAGLAGGSSDAAATLAGLDRLWGLGLPPGELARLGAAAGSDVAFFLGGPAAWCAGRGEVVTPLRAGRTYHLVLASPPVGLSTAEVFSNLVVPAEPLRGDDVRRAVEGGAAAEEVGRLLFNRLQPAAEALCPAVAAARARLTALGPAGVLMSGSGSTVFALCRHAAEALRLARALDPVREDGGGLRVRVVRSCD
jgi:4-diphosphocytidyl-2-C-methyl-D-erythritol kinase